MKIRLRAQNRPTVRVRIEEQEARQVVAPPVVAAIRILVRKVVVKVVEVGNNHLKLNMP